MSISVIESAYATYLGDKRVTGTQMAVLICLAKFANDGTLATFPSDSKVAQYSHFAPSAVLNARKALKKIGAIDWVPGGKTRDGGLISNRYVFPFYKPSKQDRGAAQQSAGVERYESLSTDSVDKYKTNASTAFANEVSTDAPTPPRGGPTPSGDDPHPSTKGDPPLHEVSNTEINSKNNSERNGKVLCAHISSLSDKLAVGFSANPPKPANASAGAPYEVQKAMRVCGVTDAYNRNVFAKLSCQIGAGMLLVEANNFSREIEGGKHKDVKNRAAYLTKRLKVKYEK